MRNLARYILTGLAILFIDGCTTNSIPPSDGIYTGTITTGTGNGTDNIYAIIDSTGAGIIIDTTNPSITRFTISSIDDSGNFTAPTTSFAGSGFGVESGATATSGSISATLNGNSGNAIGGGDTTRNTITGNIITSIGASQPFTLTYQPSTYEDNVTSLTTIVTPTSSGAATLSFNYTPPVVTAGVTPPQTTVSLTLSDAQSTSTTNLAYTFTGTDSLNCTYSGVISMPNSSFNAFDLSMTVNCGGASSTRTGLAYVNGTSPVGLTLEYNDGSNFAVAANAALTN